LRSPPPSVLILSILFALHLAPTDGPKPHLSPPHSAPFISSAYKLAPHRSARADLQSSPASSARPRSDRVCQRGDKHCHIAFSAYMTGGSEGGAPLVAPFTSLHSFLYSTLRALPRLGTLPHQPYNIASSTYAAETRRALCSWQRRANCTRSILDTTNAPGSRDLVRNKRVAPVFALPFDPPRRDRGVPTSCPHNLAHGSSRLPARVLPSGPPHVANAQRSICMWHCLSPTLADAHQNEDARTKRTSIEDQREQIGVERVYMRRR